MCERAANPSRVRYDDDARVRLRRVEQPGRPLRGTAPELSGALAAGRRHVDPALGPRVKMLRVVGRDLAPELSLPLAEAHLAKPLIVLNGAAERRREDGGRLRRPAKIAADDTGHLRCQSIGDERSDHLCAVRSEGDVRVADAPVLPRDRSAVSNEEEPRHVRCAASVRYTASSTSWFAAPSASPVMPPMRRSK